MLQKNVIIQDDYFNILHLKKEVRMIVEITQRSSNGKNLCGLGGHTGSRNCVVENLQMEQGNACDSISSNCPEQVQKHASMEQTA